MHKKRLDADYDGDGSVSKGDSPEIFCECSLGKEEVVAEAEVKEEEEAKAAEHDEAQSQTETPGNEERCCVCGSEANIQVCSGCKATKYCSKKCQKSHHGHHSVYCNAIRDLEKLEKDKIYKDKSVREKQLDFWKQAKIVKLVGNKPMLSCFLNEKSTKALWDTGSMISLVDRDWLKENHPDAEVVPVAEFLEGEELTIRAANKSEIPFDGVVVLKFSLGPNEDGLSIPALVASSAIAEPIIGYNVIEHMVLHGTEADREKLKSCLCSNSSKWEPLIALIEKQASDPDFLTEIKTSESVHVPAGSKVRMRCRVKAQANSEEQTVLFTPKIREGDDELQFNECVSKLKRGKTNYVYVDAINESRVDKVVSKGSMIGSVHSVSAVIPMMRSVEVKPQKPKQKATVNAVDTGDAEEEVAAEWMPEFDLTHLDEDQKKLMTDMLKEVKGVFSRSDMDIGDVKDFEMKIHLTDNVPVKEPYRKVPRHMYSEVKNFIDDMIANGWVRESCSSYSAPIVCARKKCGGLRLCVDYRRLNNKTIPDAQPIPRIQDILDNLGGKQWFSTLDMSKAYHQGYISEEFRHLTAFSTPWTLLEWIRIPFGLRNSPPAFQRYINQLLGDMKGVICEPYLDDILVHSVTFEQHVEDLKKVLLRLMSRGVKLRGFKCHFAKKEVRYLGRMISGEGYRADPAEMAALNKFREPPKNIGELRSLLGFSGYYRGYVQGFAQRVKPLYDLLKSDVTEKDTKAKQKDKKAA